MDLVSGLGDAGFRWIFAIDAHGPFINKRMTDEASEYFEDVYGGTMVNLAGVIHPDPPAVVRPLTDSEQKEDGLAVHAGLIETSWMIYVRPDLIDSEHKNAPVFPPLTQGLSKLAESLQKKGCAPERLLRFRQGDLNTKGPRDTARVRR